MSRILPEISGFDVALLDLSQVENPFPPSSNTGGNLVTLPKKPHFDFKSCQKVKIDYLSFTSRKSPDYLKECLSFFAGDIVYVQKVRGWMNYPIAFNMMQNGEHVGLIAWGSASSNRNYVSITGAGCKLWTDYHVELVRQVLIDCDARITRLDLALDFYHGEVTYDDCEKALEDGEFRLKGGGRKPKISRIGNENHYGNMGRSLYVGSEKSSKRINLYEKGLEQFGKLPAVWLENQTEESVISHRLDGTVGMAGQIAVVDWLRAEVRYSNDDRDLDFGQYEMLILRDQYFAGAYPFCARVLDLADGIRPPTLLTETEADIEKMKLNGKNSYGGVFHGLRLLGYTDTEIVDCMDAGAPSKRMIKAGFFNHLSRIVPF